MGPDSESSVPYLEPLKINFRYVIWPVLFSVPCSVHESGAVHECMYCLQPFADFDEMRAHVGQHGGRYSCRTCGAPQPDFAALVAHRAAHARQVPPDQKQRLDCADVEADMKRGYLSCPKAKLR